MKVTIHTKQVKHYTIDGLSINQAYDLQNDSHTMEIYLEEIKNGNIEPSLIKEEYISYIEEE